MTLTQIQETVEAPAETTTVRVEPTPVQAIINDMISLARGGRWIQSRTTDGRGHYCTAGLAQKALGWLR